MIKIKCNELVDFAIGAEMFYDNLALNTNDKRMPELAHKAEWLKKQLRQFGWQTELIIIEKQD